MLTCNLAWRRPPSLAGMEPPGDRPFMAPHFHRLSHASGNLRGHSGTTGDLEDRGLKLLEMGGPGPGVKGGEGHPCHLKTPGAHWPPWAQTAAQLPGCGRSPWRKERKLQPNAGPCSSVKRSSGPRWLESPPAPPSCLCVPEGMCVGASVYVYACVREHVLASVRT